MAEYHVSNGLAGIYAGTLKPNNKTEWKDKSICTDEAIEAVRDYMVQDCLGGLSCSKASNGGYEWTLKDGRKVKLMISVHDNIYVKRDFK